MAGKPITRGSRRVAFAIYRLSKNTLADILLDKVAADYKGTALMDEYATQERGKP